MRWTPMVLVLVLTVGFSSGRGNAQEVTENPMYLTWSKYKPGTKATQKVITRTSGSVFEITKTYTLVSINEDVALIEIQQTQKSPDGTVVTNSPYESKVKRALPRGMKSVAFGQPKRAKKLGEETIEAAGRTFETRWYETEGQTEAGPTLNRTWVSLDAPAMLVKYRILSSTSDKVVEMELVSIETP